MTESIRTWPDPLFYFSSASTANVREQLIKQQAASKLVRALSDASTVDSNGDTLQDVLVGLSLGTLSQRHRRRVLYDSANDTFVVQRNIGTDASKIWVALATIDASGNLTTLGSISTDSLTTTAGGVTLGGNLDVNDYYLRNVDKVLGTLRTDGLIVHGHAKIKRSLQVGGSSLFSGASSFYGPATFDGTFGIGSRAAQVLGTPLYAETTANQNLLAATLTDVTEISGLDLPNTAAPLTSRRFHVSYVVQVANTAGVEQFVFARVYNGPNGTQANTAVYVSSMMLSAAAILGDSFSGEFIFSPVASNATRIGLAVQSVGTSTLLGSASSGRCTFTVREVT